MVRGSIHTDNKTKTNYINGKTTDIISVIHANLPRAARQVKEVCTHFKGSSTLATCRNIFNFLKENINYIPDGDNQDIKLPGRFVADAVGDCKSYSLFTAAILKNLGIPFTFRYASYTNDSTPQHVYIVADDAGTPIYIDAVYGTFNKEKSFTYKIDYPMNVRTLSGVGAIDLKKVWTGTKTATLAGPRGAYLGLLRLNLFGWATLLNALLERPDKAQQLKDKWNSLGGNFTDLKAAIYAGKGKKPIWNKNVQVAGIGSIEATIAAATAIIAALSALVAEAKRLYGKVLPGENGSDPSKYKDYKPDSKPDDSSSQKGILSALAAALLLFN